jgi:hypothetical protein
MVSTGVIEINAGCSDIAFRSCTSEVFIDDKFAGYTPIQIFVPTGNHNYKLIKTDYSNPPPLPSPSPPPPLMTGVANVQYGTRFSINVNLVNNAITGALSIHSTPDGAKIFIDGEDKKMITPAIISGLTPGDHKLRLTLPGYEETTESFEMSLGKSILSYPILKQMKDFGTLYIYPTPVLYGTIVPYIFEGANIYIDNVDTGKFVPSPITGLTKGVHTFRIARPGVEDREGIFVINGGDVLLISVYPIILPKTGMVVIRAFPLVGDMKSANVYIDGKYTGEFTNIRFALPEGIHTYKLQLEGYDDVEGKFNIVTDSITSVTTYMKRIGTPLLGKLNISSIPPGASVHIDDVEIGQYAPTTVHNLSDGDYVYRLSKTGYLDTTGTFTISNGSTMDLNPTLIQSDNILDISCNVIASMIYIDNHTDGWTTPSEIVGLSPGTHTYRLVIPNTYGGGFEDATGTFNIEKNKTTVVRGNISLTKSRDEGSLIINSIPIGAQVFIDDVDTKSVTPNSITGVSSGIHKIRLALPGYKDWIGTVSVIHGSMVSIYETLIHEKA